MSDWNGLRCVQCHAQLTGKQTKRCRACAASRKRPPSGIDYKQAAFAIEATQRWERPEKRELKRSVRS